jgi:peptidoglycan/LPS O-acetylase OafA/YrhL
MTIALRLIAWTLAAVVTFFTLGPPSYRPQAYIGQDGDHAIAFLLVGVAFALAYRRNRPLIALVAVALTGIIEILQYWTPDRHARMSDFVVDALAVCAGLAAGTALDWASAAPAHRSHEKSRRAMRSGADRSPDAARLLQGQVSEDHEMPVRRAEPRAETSGI